MVKKILLITEYYPPDVHGGGELSAQQLAEDLANKGMEMTVLTSRLSAKGPTGSRSGVRVLRRTTTGDHPGRMLGNLKRLSYDSSLEKELGILLQKESFDIIHCLNSTSTRAPSRISLDSRTRLIATVNSYAALCPKGNLFYKERSPCTGCNFTKFLGCINASEYIGKQKISIFFKYNPAALVFLYRSYKTKEDSLAKFSILARSNFIAEHISKNSITRNKIGIEPPIVHLEEKEEKINGLEEQTRGKKVISCVASLEKIKGVDILISGFSRIKDKNSVLVIAGDGSQKKRLESLARASGEKNRIIFLGKIKKEQVNNLYSMSDMLAFTPIWPEPSSRVLIEGLSHGLPIIATKVGGNTDDIEDGKNGYLIKADPIRAADAINNILVDNDVRERFGKFSKELYKKKFMPDKILESITEFYNYISA